MTGYGMNRPDVNARSPSGSVRPTPPISVLTKPPAEIAPGTIVLTVVFRKHFSFVQGIVKMAVNTELFGLANRK